MLMLPVDSVQGGTYGHELSFVENFVKFSAGWWPDTVTALLPNGDSGISDLVVNKR